jgi:hypothetical protein
MLYWFVILYSCNAGGPSILLKVWNCQTKGTDSESSSWLPWQAKGHAPRCLGVSRKLQEQQLWNEAGSPQQVLEPDFLQSQPPVPHWDKHLCLGCSIYPSLLSKQIASGQGDSWVPYCEGIEVRCICLSMQMTSCSSVSGKVCHAHCHAPILHHALQIRL